MLFGLRCSHIDKYYLKTYLRQHCWILSENLLRSCAVAKRILLSTACAIPCITAYLWEYTAYIFSSTTKVVPVKIRWLIKITTTDSPSCSSNKYITTAIKQINWAFIDIYPTLIYGYYYLLIIKSTQFDSPIVWYAVLHSFRVAPA